MKRTSEPPRAARTRPGAWRRLWRDRRGATAVLVAICTPILLAIAGLAVDVGWWYTIKRQNQSAADTAALSAAYEVFAGKTNPVSNLQPAARQAATQNGYSGSALTGTGTCPGTGSFVCYPYSDSLVSSGVEVVLQQQQPSWLALFGSLANVTIANRAVAELSPQQNGCVLGLEPNNNNDVSITGAAVITLPGCVVASNSNTSQSVTVSGQLTAQSIVTEGRVSVTGSGSANLTKPATTDAAAAPDPYASQVSGISLPTSCANSDPNVNGTVTLQPGCYNGMTFQSKANATLAAGPYFVNGSFTIQGGATVQMSPATCAPNTTSCGVTIIVYGNGQISIQRRTAPIVTLAAPTSGGVPYQGLLFYQVAADNHNASFAGCVNSCTLTGGIYLPTATDHILREQRF